MTSLSTRGFTFLELIISLTIVAMIVLAVNAALEYRTTGSRQGPRSWF